MRTKKQVEHQDQEADKKLEQESSSIKKHRFTRLRFVSALVAVLLVLTGGGLVYFFTVWWLPLEEHQSQDQGFAMLVPRDWHEEVLDDTAGIEEIESIRMGAASFFGGLTMFTESNREDVNVLEANESVQIFREDFRNNPREEAVYFDQIEAMVESIDRVGARQASSETVSIDGYPGKIVTIRAQNTPDTEDLEGSANQKTVNHKERTLYLFVDETTQFTVSISAFEPSPLEIRAEDMLMSFRLI